MKLLCVEDGSVDVDALEEYVCDNLKGVKVVVYRQGANQPYLIDNKDDLKDIYQEIKENAELCFPGVGENFYKVPAKKLREIFEKRIKGE